MVLLLQDTGALYKMMVKGMMQLSHERRQKAESFRFTEKVAGGGEERYCWDFHNSEGNE